MAKASFKERARQQREQEILQTAARMMQERGYANLNMDEIAEEVGVSKPTLYQHFKSKDDMVMQTLLHSMERMDEHIATLTEDSPLDQLAAILRGLLRSHVTPDGLPMAMVDPHILVKAQSHDAFNERYVQVGIKLRQLVIDGIAQGEINPALSEVVVIGAMFSMLTVLQGPAIMNDDSDSIEALIDGIVTVFRNGVRASQT